MFSSLQSPPVILFNDKSKKYFVPGVIPVLSSLPPDADFVKLHQFDAVHESAAGVTVQVNLVEPW